MTRGSTDGARSAARPSPQRSPNGTRCSRCKRWWTGTSQAHCVSCCTAGPDRGHFSSADVFDRHRVGGVDDRRCLDPHTATDKNGNPVFKAISGPHGLTWRRWRKDDGTGWYEKLGQAA